MQQKVIPNANRSEATQAKLLRAARKLFVAKGFAATSTPELVRAAGVTRGALYHHYADKKDLFRAVVARESQQVAIEIDQATRTPKDALDGLLTGGEAYFRSMAVPGRAFLMLIEGPSVLGSEVMGEMYARDGDQQLREGLEALVEAGLLKRSELDAMTTLLSAMFDRAALAIAGGAPAVPFRAAIRKLLSRLGG